MMVRSRGIVERSVCMALVLLAGCGRAFGPEPMVTTTLVGRMHIGKRPIGQGWIQVIPVQGTLGRLRSAPLSPDGSFRIENAPVGRVAIGFAGPPPRPSGDPEVDFFLRRADGSLPARRTITASAPFLDVDLEEERLLFEKMRRSAR